MYFRCAIREVSASVQERNMSLCKDITLCTMYALMETGSDFFITIGWTHY